MQKLVLATLLLLGTFPWVSEPASAQNTVTCESWKGRTTRCRIDAGRRRDVRIVQQLSSESCDGKWYYDDGYVVVRDGCRAVFQTRGSNGGGGRERRYREFTLPRVGSFVVDRTSYYDDRNVREFDAIVNNSQERWWVNCRTSRLGTGNRAISSSRASENVIDFVCTDRGLSGNNRGNRYDDRY